MLPFVPWNRIPPAGACGVAAAVQELACADPRTAARALDRLYRDEAPRVYRYALALCGNAAWAADATQEAFVALALRPQGFNPAKGLLGAYLAGMARHTLAAHWRESRQTQAWPSTDDTNPEDGADGPVHEMSPEALLVRAQDGEAVWAALRLLPPAFREALILVDLQERPYAEAAAIAGVELNTLRTRLHRGRQKLAALLSPASAASPASPTPGSPP
jgi:RNA polymerase sigma-70 factor (ECF subfamily)